jgi:class 3 adenylate cyclase
MKAEVTFLFTDIEGSTHLLQQLGGQFTALLAQEQRILREACEAHGGQVVDTPGDAFFVAFPRAGGAIRAVLQAQRALAAQPWPEGVQVRVRMGLHTGE